MVYESIYLRGTLSPELYPIVPRGFKFSVSTKSLLSIFRGSMFQGSVESDPLAKDRKSIAPAWSGQDLSVDLFCGAGHVAVSRVPQVPEICPGSEWRGPA